MPKKATVRKARKARRQGKAPTTQASEFVHEEMHKLKTGKGRKKARSRKQAIAIGLSEARRSGVKLRQAPKRSSKRSSAGGKKAA